MQQLTMTRRSFVKASIVAGAALALSTKLSTSSFTKTDKAFAIETSGLKKIVTTCHGCIQACGARAYVQDNVVVKLEGHPLAPTSLGSMCLKGLSQLHTAYSPRRVIYPIKRSGARGAENMAWERISWDDAIDLAASKIADAMQKYGTYSLFASVGGGGSFSMSIATNFPMHLGSPTVFEPGCAQCYLPRYAVAAYMYNGADQSIADCAFTEFIKGLSPYERARGVTQDTVSMVVWGAQPSVSQTAQSGRAMAELRDTGCKTVVIDPNMSPDAVKADVWIRVRPGADGAMVLCWWRYIIDKKLYDEKFCKTWTNLPFIINPDTKVPYLATEIFPDYEQINPENTPAYVCYDNITKTIQPFEYMDKNVDPELFWSGTVDGKRCRTAGQVWKDVADPYTLQETERVCWVPADTIEAGIRIYTDAPVSGIALGVATDMQQNASQVPVGTTGLDMIMGYVNKKGAALTQVGSLPASAPARPLQRFNGFGGSYSMTYGIGYVIGQTKQQNEDRINGYPEGMGLLQQGSMYVMNQVLLDRLGMNNHRGLYHWAHSHIPSVLEAIKTGIPYKPRVWFDFSGNKMCMLGNSAAWYNEFDQVDFCMCQYPMITSFQAEVADLIFPLEEWLEQPAASGFGQLNYRFPSPGIIHLGETVPHNVPSQKVSNAVCVKLNNYLDTPGTEIVLGSTTSVVGVQPASPSQTSTDPSGPNDKQTSNNSSYYAGSDKTKYVVRFPFVPFSGGLQEESVVRRTHAATYGASDYDTFMNNVDTYMEPFGKDYDVPNPNWNFANFINPMGAYWSYGQHEVTANDGLPQGFGTESRKCEVYCTLQVKMSKDGYPYTYPRTMPNIDKSIGTEILDTDPNYEYVGLYSPVCHHIEPIESPIPGYAGYDSEYPLVMTSGRVYYSHHGTMRHAPFIRELYPVPDVRIHPDTAEKYGLKHMDWVKITSRRNTTTGRVYITRGQDKGVLWMERHWFPECFDTTQATKTGGWRECNVNVITKNTAPFNEVFGSYTNRGFTVKIEKGSRPDRIWVEPKQFAPFLPGPDNQYVAGVGSLLTAPQTSPVVFNDWNRT